MRFMMNVAGTRNGLGRWKIAKVVAVRKTAVRFPAKAISKFSKMKQKMMNS